MTLVVMLLLWAAGIGFLFLAIAAIERRCERANRIEWAEAEVRLHKARRIVELNQLKFDIARDAEQTRIEIDRELRERGR